MNAMVSQAETSLVQGGAVPRRRRLLSRALALVAAAGLLGLLTGDGRAVAFIQGIDPLDVLNLKVRPNVILVLDSSGSMTELTMAGPSKWDAIRAALTSFLRDPGSAGLGVGLQYFPLTKAGVPPGRAATADCGTSGP